MISPATISEYIDRQVAAFKKIALREFLIDLKTQFYPEQDISFMDEFLSMSKKENEGQFIVHHEKLYEYGATKSTQSNHVKERLQALNMVEGEDYLLTRSREQKKSGSGGSNKKVYMLTPRTFKRILIGATRHPSHDVDVTMYADYYLFLEKAVGYYMDYQLGLEKALSSLKDGTIKEQCVKIDNLIDEVRESKSMIDDLKNLNLDQSSKLEDLMAFAADTNATVHGLNQSQTRKSQLSTVSLDNKNLENYYGSAMLLLHDDFGAPYVRVQNMRCQRKDLIPKMRNLIEGEYKTNKNLPVKGNHGIAIPPIYFPNAVTLLIKCVERFEKIVRKQKIKEFNAEFKDEIKAGSLEKLTASNFPVKMKRLFFEYHPNNVMSFNEVIMIVVDMIKQSQGCALDLPATKQLQMLSDKQMEITEKRFAKDGKAAQEGLLKEVSEEISKASQDLADNIFNGVFETPKSDDEE